MTLSARALIPGTFTPCYVIGDNNFEWMRRHYLTMRAGVIMQNIATALLPKLGQS